MQVQSPDYRPAKFAAPAYFANQVYSTWVTISRQRVPAPMGLLDARS